METEPNVGYTEALGAASANPTDLGLGRDTLYSTVDGQEWHLSGLQQRFKAQFEQYIRRNARRSIDEVSRQDGPDAGNEMRSVFIADMAAGHYNWDGRYVRQARGDITGLCYLMVLLINGCRQDQERGKRLDP